MSEIETGDLASQNTDSNDESPYSLNRGCEGCLVAWVVMLALMIFVSFVLNRGLQWLSDEQKEALVDVNWLIGLSVGGYVAARRGKHTGWSNALLVGIFAQLMIVGPLLDNRGQFQEAYEFLADPFESWPRLLAMILTIPAALIGGLIWSRQINE